MKPGQESQTAVLVAMARAAAHGVTMVERFSDPTAMVLLPEDARERVRRFHNEPVPRRFTERLERTVFLNRSQIMVARTVAVDDVVRAAAARQLVILGAGLDGRAWRMAELKDTVVYEVDHPDSQREKRARIVALTQAAREVRFVPVDFTRDSLDQALVAAGHDATQPTTWIWEGVVMYLTRAEIEATLAAIGRRSAPFSRLVVVYHRPALILRLVGPMVRRLGEPLRSALTPETMRELLSAGGFAVLSDQGIPEIGAGLSPEVARSTRKMRHVRVVVAQRITDRPQDARPGASSAAGR